MSTEMRKYIDTFKQRLTESENLNISDVRSSFTLDDLKKAFESGRRMSWTDINQEEQEPYYYSFDEWYEEWVNSKK